MSYNKVLAVAETAAIAGRALTSHDIAEMISHANGEERDAILGIVNGPDKVEAREAILRRYESRMVHADHETRADSRPVETRAEDAPQGDAVPAESRQRVNALVSAAPRAEARHGLPLADGQGFRDLPEASGGSIEELGEYVRGLYRGERRANEGTATAGGYLVPTPLAANVLDLARTQTRVVQAGAQIIPMNAQTLKIARLDSDPSPAWRNESAAIASGDLTFGQVSFTARSLAVVVKASVELVEDAPNFASTLADSLAKAFAIRLDAACLYGSGTAPEPRGLYNTAGISKTALATNGAVLNYQSLIDATALLRGADYTETGVLLHPRTDAKLNIVGSDGHWLVRPAYLSVPILPTTAVKADQTQGTASGVASDVFVGDFRNLLIGQRADFTLKVLNERYADTGEVGFVAALRADLQVARTGAFRILTGAL